MKKNLNTILVKARILKFCLPLKYQLGIKPWKIASKVEIIIKIGLLLNIGWKIIIKDVISKINGIKYSLNEVIWLAKNLLFTTDWFFATSFVADIENPYSSKMRYNRPIDWAKPISPIISGPKTLATKGSKRISKNESEKFEKYKYNGFK